MLAVLAVLAPGVRSSEAAIRFAPPQNLAAGSQVSHVTTADLNQDGIWDLLCTNAGEGTLSVFLADGAGGYLPRADYEVGSAPAGIAVQDLNFDDYPDVVVANEGSNSVSVLMCGEGGVLGSRTDYPVGAGPTCVVLFDTELDDVRDLAVANTGGSTITMLTGDGLGGFTHRADIAVPGSPVSLATGDVDMLNGEDVVAACSPDAVVLVPSLAGGDYGEASLIMTAADPSAVFLEYLTVDPAIDLVVSQRQTSIVSVLLGLEAGGFAPPVDYPTGTHPAHLELSTLDGNAYFDIITASETEPTLSVLRGAADGVFLPSQTVPIDAPADDLTSVSHDLDGFMDLVTAHAAAGVLAIHDQSPYLEATATFVTQPASAEAGTILSPAVQVRLTMPNGDPIPFQPIMLFLDGSGELLESTTEVDTDADGIATFDNLKIFLTGTKHLLATCNFANYFSSDAFSIIPGAPFGLEFQQQPTSVNSGRAMSPPLREFLHDHFHNAIADGSVMLELQGNGTMTGGEAHTTDAAGIATFDDLRFDTLGEMTLDATSEPGLHALSVPFEVVVAPFASFADPQTFAAGPGAARIAFGDLNGDGAKDLAVTNSSASTIHVFMGDGSGSFGDRREYLVGREPSTVQFAQVDEDGKLDLLVGNAQDRNVSIFFGRGDGTFRPPVVVSGDGRFDEFTVADVNQDGKLDMLQTGWNFVSVLLGTGGGAFGQRHDFAVGGYCNELLVTDVNRDGKPDIVAALFYSGKMSVLLGAGDGTFAPPLDVASGNAPIEFAVWDWNRDGSRDLVVVNSDDNTISILPGHGDGTFGSRTTMATGDWPTSIAIGDLDLDGFVDLAVANNNDATISLYRSHGDGTFSPPQVLAPTPVRSGLVIADLDNNGAPDLAGADFSNATVSIFRNLAGLPTPTLLELFRATPEANGVRVEWQLTDAAALRTCSLERAASEAGEWTAVDAAARTEGALQVVVDADALAGVTSWYRLRGTLRSGAPFTFGPVSAEGLALVRTLELATPWPNPSRGATTLSFGLPARAYVRLSLVDLQGREVALLADGVRDAGRHVALLDATDLSPGIYFARLQSAGEARVRRLVIVK